ncbi:acyl carrier protein [Nocardia sp. NBC_00565]|uniref:acyl carrier protein n=1 Tax=Nocardia sp. NBC_00565 TaxID=2975993 RepID=UPI002E802647|nr:acyl carrier protein [Nocardia sp. NBC_00565]WUC06892.1 acyl carrier protein [Nocardia sp. NBC_00565]
MPNPTETAAATGVAVCDLFKEELKTEVQLDDVIEQLPNIESVRFMRILTRIEDHFGIVLDDDEAIFGAATVGELAQIVTKSSSGTHV